MKPNQPFSRDWIIRIFFFSVFLLLTYQLFQITRPFLPSLLGAALLAVAFFPLYDRLLRALKSPGLTAAAMTVVVVGVTVLPLTALGWFFFKEAGKLLPTVQNLIDEIQHGQFPELRPYLPALLDRLVGSVSDHLKNSNIDLRPMILENARLVASHITAFGAAATRNVIMALIQGVILVVVLFFAFRDGRRLWQWGWTLVPMSPVNKRAVSERAYETFRAVVVGGLATSATQGVVAMLGFVIAQVNLPILLGLMTAMSSLLGASVLVTIPVALSVWPTRPWAGMFLLVWAVGVVGLIDNFMKPILIGSRARMPFLLIFFSIIGGIKAYGFLGFFLGPIIVASFLTFVKIYREEYA